MKRKPDTKLGEIIEIYPEEEYENRFRKIKFVIETPGAYSQQLLFELHNDKTDIIAAYQEGDFVRVSFDIKGNRGIEGQHYTNLVAWRIECAE